MKSETDVLKFFEEMLLAVELSDARRKQLLQNLRTEQADKESRLRSTLHVLATLPEFQLG